MSGKQRGNGKMIRLADKLYGNKVLSIGIALGIAGASYILALLFGDGILEQGAAFRAPLMGLICFGGMFLVMGFQLVNPFCSPGFMDSGELFFGFFVGGYALFWFVIRGFWKLFGEMASEAVVAIFMFAGLWCGLCIIHNMRK